MSVLLGFMFIQSVIATLLPKSNQSPLLADYLLGCLILSAVNLVVSALIMMVFNLGESKSATVRRIERRLRRHNAILLRIYSFGLFLCKSQREPAKLNANSRPPVRSKKASSEDSPTNAGMEHGEELELQLSNNRKTSSPLQLEANYASNRPLLVGSDLKSSSLKKAHAATNEHQASITEPSLFVELEAIMPERHTQKGQGPNGDEGMISLSVSPHSATNSNNEGDNENEKHESDVSKPEKRVKPEHEKDGDDSEGEVDGSDKDKLNYDPVEFWHKMADFINRIVTTLLIFAQFFIVVYFLIPIYV